MGFVIEEAPGPGAADGRPRVVVGVDGSDGSRAALVHAVSAAARRGADLEVVSSYAVELYYLGGAAIDVPSVAGIRDDTHGRARGFVADVLGDPVVADLVADAHVTVRLVVSEGPAAQTLVDRAEGAELLVVGSRGRGAMRSALLGSVALHCVTHAPCPVVVVHPAPAAARRPPLVVVGVDGSDESRAALVAAVEEADRLGAEVTAVATYVLADPWADMIAVDLPSAEEIRAEIEQRTDRAVAQVLATRSPGAGASPVVRTEVVEGPAAEVLVERSGAADLLVVGSRGRGALRGLLLGSVALHCAMHGRGAVMVVRGDVRRAPDDHGAAASGPASAVVGS